MPDQPNENAGQPQEVGLPVTENVNTTTPVAGNVAGKESTAAMAKRPAPEDFGQLTKHRLPWGVAGVFIWLLLFSAGVLIPAEPSRKNLGWKPESESQANTKKLEERITELEKKAKVTKPGEETAPKVTDSTKQEKPKDAAPPAPVPPVPPTLDDTTSQGTPPTAPDVTKTLPEQKEKDSQDADSKDTKNQESVKPSACATQSPSKFWSFVVATFTFTPLNIGFLCVLAAFIGGCSINKNEIHRIQQEIFDIEANPPIPPNPDLTRLRQRLDYLTEHPGYSTIRGLVVYLIIISGLFIIGAPLTGESGTQSVTLGQYMKLAGLFSFFGYLSGYDPTVFSSVIGLGTKQLSNGKTPG